MAIREDVLVVGGGLAGTASALAAARTGASVRLVSHKQSTFRSASGLIDVLGSLDGDPVADPFDALAALPAGHPYERAGRDALRAGLALFDESVPGYAGGHTDRNALVPTHGGTVKPTARYPDAVAPGLASDDRRTLLVGFESQTDFDAPLAAAHLRSAGVPFDVRGVTVEFPGELNADAKVTRFARLLDDDDSVGEEVGGPRARRALAERVRPHLGDAERVGFPALLGEERTDAIRQSLARALGAAVFEVPTGPPSLPGMRLETALFDALDDAGVRLSTGNPVVGYEAEDGRVASVDVEHTGNRVPYGAEQFVLATGGLVGKGIDSDRSGVREPVFGCRVPAPGDRYDWFDDGAFGDHPFARFGVVVDEEMRPTGADGAPEFGNLRAAGAVVGGADFAGEKSGSGVSLATGYAAGTAAGDVS